MQEIKIMLNENIDEKYAQWTWMFIAQKETASQGIA